MKQHFVMLAAYNAWCNQRLFDAAATLPDADYRADRIWMRRFTGQGEAPTRLDAILFEEFGSLRDARWREDERIMSYVEGLSDSDLASRFRYRPLTNPVEVEQPLAPALLHVFNHQTHHRGQVHALFTGLGQDAPSLDLALFQRVSGVGMT